MNTKLTGFAKSYAENRQTFINTLSDIIGVKPDIFAEVLKSKTKNMYPNDYAAISEVALSIVESDCIEFGHKHSILLPKPPKSEHEIRRETYEKIMNHYYESVRAWLVKIRKQHGYDFLHSNLKNLINFFNKKYQKKYGKFDFCDDLLNSFK